MEEKRGSDSPGKRRPSFGKVGNHEQMLEGTQRSVGSNIALGKEKKKAAGSRNRRGGENLRRPKKSGFLGGRRQSRRARGVERRTSAGKNQRSCVRKKGSGSVILYSAGRESQGGKKGAECHLAQEQRFSCMMRKGKGEEKLAAEKRGGGVPLLRLPGTPSWRRGGDITFPLYARFPKKKKGRTFAAF